MRRTLAVTLLLAACGSADAPQADIPATAALSAQDLAGDWNFVVRPEGGDSVLGTGVLSVLPGDSIRITQQMSDGAAEAVNATFDGDSMMTRSGPYPSSFRPGMMVTTMGVIRRTADTMHGITTAHYSSETTPDSVVKFAVTYIRQP